MQSQFAYTPERARWRQVATTGGVTETTHYVAGLLEKVSRPGQTLWKHTVATPSGLSALYLRRSDGTADTYYLLRDHLGSTDQVLKAAGSTVVVAESFGAFGARRGSNWSGGPSAADLTVIAATTAEGFTGHDMLDGVGLIHMHGRVYDPTMGRFLSVDPIVRDTAASQSWNGYGYVEGRMLSATDPDGFTTDVDCPSCVKPRADPPRSAWTTSVIFGGTERQRLELGTDPITGLETAFVINYWAFSDPFPFVSMIDPSMGALDLAAPSGIDGGGQGDKAQEEEASCANRAVRASQLLVGGAMVIGGAAQTLAGISQAVGGIGGAPATAGVSLSLVGLGTANAAYGASAVLDGGLMVQSAINGSGDSPTIFRLIGSRYGGDLGGQMGDMVGLGGFVALAAHSNARAITRTNLVLDVVAQVQQVVASHVCDGG